MLTSLLVFGFPSSEWNLTSGNRQKSHMGSNLDCTECGVQLRCHSCKILFIALILWPLQEHNVGTKVLGIEGRHSVAFKWMLYPLRMLYRLLDHLVQNLIVLEGYKKGLHDTQNTFSVRILIIIFWAFRVQSEGIRRNK